MTPPAGAALIPTNGTPPDGCPSGMRWGECKGGSGHGDNDEPFSPYGRPCYPFARDGRHVIADMTDPFRPVGRNSCRVARAVMGGFNEGSAEGVRALALLKARTGRS